MGGTFKTINVSRPVFKRFEELMREMPECRTRSEALDRIMTTYKKCMENMRRNYGKIQ